MKKIDFGQTISILANLGVLAGIVILIIEIDQHNDALAFQARQMVTAARSAGQQAIAQNAGGIVDVLAKARTGKELTWAENYRLGVYNANRVRTYQDLYREVLGGTLSEPDLPVGQWCRAFRDGPRMKEYFDNNRQDELDPEFVEFLESRVIGQC